MADKQPTFAERTKQMRESANTLIRMADALTDIGDALHAEADHMSAAEKRFAERNAKHERKASR
jgi:hypothetical protein